MENVQISNNRIDNENVIDLNKNIIFDNYNYINNDDIQVSNLKKEQSPDYCLNENPNLDKIINQFPTTEIKDWEQYFFTENVLIDIIDALEYEENILCLCTPAVADAFWRLKNRKIMCLDIDKRFDYLPGFVYFDLLKPHRLNFKPNVIIVDPPFFKINLIDLYNAIDFLTEGDKMTKIIFAFVKREQKFLLYTFESYNLQLTKFKLEYRSVDATKWDNYGIYTNYEFKKMKFLEKKKQEKLISNKNDKNDKKKSKKNK